MNTKRFYIFVLFVLIYSFVPTRMFGLEKMTDEELDEVTAGSADPTAESKEALIRIPFHYRAAKGDVEGEVFVLPGNTFDQQGIMQLMDNAQSNLRSLINVNAVNSPVQILLNLNINIDSSIGNINQLNNLLSSQGP